MKAYSETNFWDKVGEFLSHAGRRALAGLLSTALGLLIILTIGNVYLWLSFIAMPLFLGGFFTILSFIEMPKLQFYGTYTLQTQSGDFLPYAVVKISHKAYFPMFPIMLCCPFFYIPYKTQYVLIKNAGNTSELRFGMGITSSFLEYILFDTEVISRKQFEELKKNNILILDELRSRICVEKQNFENKTRFFVSNGLIDVLYKTDTICICNLSNITYGIFCYESNNNGEPCGFITNANFAYEVAKNNSQLFLAAARMESDEFKGHILVLNQNTYDYLYKNRKSINCPGEDINYEIEDKIRKLNQ